MNEHYTKLKNFVLAANDLAEQIKKDIETGVAVANKKPVCVITDKTVLKLSKFYSSQEKFQKGIDILNAITDELN